MASILKRGDSYSVRFKYKDHAGRICEGWESFKTKKEAQDRKISVEKELLDGTFLIPDAMTVEEMLYKWIPIQSSKHKWSPKTYTQSVAMVQNLIVPYIGKRKVQDLRTYDIEQFYATYCNDDFMKNRFQSMTMDTTESTRMDTAQKAAAAEDSADIA